MLNQVRLRVGQMNSAREIQAISETLVKVQGVADIGVNDEEGLVAVKFDPGKTDENAIRAALRQAGIEAR